MPATSSPVGDPVRAEPSLIHQAYVTHCLYDEGVSRQAGFTVRAASTHDPLLLRFAQEYPPYELPAGAGEGEGADVAAPVRLALVQVPGGPKALVHSVPLPPDRHGRANNFFSHVLFPPALGPREALATWGSPGWATDCPTSAAKDLAPLTALPRTGPINDRALAAFLQPDLADDCPDLPPGVCPPRLAGDGTQRRRLLALALRGCLRVLPAEPGTPRGRFYLLAEPGLAALLLYGAVRLLPPGLAARLTFSTYENLRHALRTYRHARVVATCPARDGEGLDEEFFVTRGYAVDTFTARCSPELEEHEPDVEEWLDLAARGEWKVVDKVYALLGGMASAVVPFREGLQAARLAQRLTAGKADARELLALKRSAWGTALLAQHREAVWPLVRDASLNDPRLLEEFADLLPEHLAELEERASQALRADPPADWQAHWRLLGAALKGDRPRLRETLQRVLPAPPYHPSLRFALLRELRDLQLSPLNPQAPLHALLKHCTADELGQFASSDLPREWFVWAVCYAILRPEMEAEGVRYLHGDDTLLRAFWEQFKLLREEDQRRAILAPLLTSGDGRGVLFLSRSLKARCPLRADTLTWALDTLRAFRREWDDFWRAEDHLGMLLDLVRELGEEAAGLWERLCARLNSDLLLSGDPYQRTLLVNLSAAAGRAGGAVPAKVTRAVADWVLLREHFEKAAAIPAEARREVLDACGRLDLDPVDLLRGYFERYVLPREVSAALLDDFVGFFHSFYPEGGEYQDAASRLLGWLGVVTACPDEGRRAAYQRYYLEQFVPVEFRWRLADEAHQAGKLLPEAYQAVEKRAHPGPAGAAGAGPGQAGPGEGWFQLAGVRPHEAGSLPGTLVRGAPWLLCAFAGGLLGVWLLGLLKIPARQLALLGSFLPLVVLASEGAALQAVAAAGAHAGRRGALRVLAGGVLAGAVLGVLGALLAAGVALLWAVPTWVALCLAGTVGGGMLAGALLGLTVPLVLGGQRLGSRLAAGPLAGAAAGVAAVGVWVSLANWLLR